MDWGWQEREPEGLGGEEVGALVEQLLKCKSDPSIANAALAVHHTQVRWHNCCSTFLLSMAPMQSTLPPCTHKTPVRISNPLVRGREFEYTGGRGGRMGI